MTLHPNSSPYRSTAIAVASPQESRPVDLDQLDVSQLDRSKLDQTDFPDDEKLDPFTSISTESDDEDLDNLDNSVNSGVDPLGPTIGERVTQPRRTVNLPQMATSYYIQAAQHNHRAFLTTNLSTTNPSTSETDQVTALSSTWLIGRSRNCAIVVHDRSVSRCHAVVGYDVQQGFYLMDVGSSNGTYLNQQRLSVLKRYALSDGDVITLCNLQFEFFIAN